MGHLMPHLQGFRRVNPLALAVLVLLWEKPMHPYQMSQTLRQRGKEASVRLNFGALYSVVEALAKAGMIEVAGIEQDGNRPARRIYQLTDAGDKELSDWLREWVSEPQKEYPRFVAALSFLPVLSPREAADHLRRRRDLLDIRIADMHRELASPAVLPELLLIEGLFELRQLECEREFVDSLVTGIESGELSGTPVWQEIHQQRAQYPGGRVPPQERDKFWKQWATWPPDPPN